MHEDDDNEFPLVNPSGETEPGQYNMETVEKGKSSLSLARPIPVFGMRHVSHQGANPNACTPEPRSKKLTESEVRELILRHGLDTQGIIAELRRLIEIGAIAMTPDNIKKLVDAEKGNGELLLRSLDVDNKMNFGDSKTIALQIINNVSLSIDKGFTKANENLKNNPVIEASVVAVKEVSDSAKKQLPAPAESVQEPQPQSVEDYVKAKRGGNQ